MTFDRPGAPNVDSTVAPGVEAGAASTIRSIGRWSLAALVLNSVIGTGVFILPGTVGGRLGWLALVAWLGAALVTLVITLCFAEVSSRFSGAGGAYLYAHTAFGSFVGLQIGWMLYLVRVVSAATQANLFSTYLGEFWPWAAGRAGSLVVSSLFIGVLAAINIRGVRSGTGVSNAFALVKTFSLVAFGVLGVVWVAGGHAAAGPAVNVTAGDWLGMLLLLMFAFGGFESALIPLGEAKDPRRDAPIALLTGLGLVTLVYLAAQLTVLATVAEPGASERPLADSARVLLGTPGASLMTAAALLSVYGWMAANMLSVPRLTMAMAHWGALPEFFGRLHSRYRTPWASTLMFALLSWGFANQAGLLQNLSLSAVSRMFVYGVVCAALPVLRFKADRPGSPVGQAQFRPPAGPLLAGLSVVASLLLITQIDTRGLVAMAGVMAIAAGHWLTVRGRETAG